MTDERVAALLGRPDRPVDQGFVNLVVRDVEIAKRLRLARQAAWRRFALEVITALALIAPAWFAASADDHGHGPAPSLMLLIVIASCSFIFRPPTAFRLR